MSTMESMSYVHGVYDAFHKQVNDYQTLTDKLLRLEGQIVLAEKQVQVARDHLCMVIEKTPTALPPDWDKTLGTVRFVGVRLAEACLQLLRDQSPMTTEDLVEGLNHGMYRWRSHSPARELNAAMLRQKSVKREEDNWIYTPIDVTPVALEATG